MTKTLMLCDCGGSMKLDADAIAKASGLACSKVHSGLCAHQLGNLAKGMEAGEVVIACGQETVVFEDLADELERDAPLTVDIRDRAGWSDEATSATPKIAALLADAQLPVPSGKAMDITSEGVCLLVGAGDIIFPVAAQLSAVLSVTCLVTDGAEVIPGKLATSDIIGGRIRNAKGTLGRFQVTVDALRRVEASGRGAFGLGAPRDGGKSECDVIFDLTGGTPLFPAHEKRDGYFRVDPGDPLAVARMTFDVAQMEGVFEKPLYVTYNEHLCAHSRADQTGCTNCLDICSTGAIHSAGDAVSIDPNICAGCGACAAVCPSGAVSYDHPPVTHVFNRLRTMASAYTAAGGKAARLLVHDAEHGAEMIALAARFGRGLPADVIPMEVSALSGFGHAEMMVAQAVGFARVDILASPTTERDALDPQIALTNAMISGLGAGEDAEDNAVRLLDPTDPDVLSDLLYGVAVTARNITPILPLGGRRDATRLAAKALAKEADAIVALPEGAPYGAVLVDQDACTLCLSCAGLCPSGALGDNPDAPELRFQEDACLQCGLCVNVCPENAISLVPQLDLNDSVMSQRVMKAEEPYECIECGTPFGVKSTIERIVDKLAGNHPMFINSDNHKLIRMCDNCRIQAQYHGDSAPFRGADRPRVRTTDDYLKDN